MGEHCRAPPLCSAPLEQWGGNGGGCGASWVVPSEMLTLGGAAASLCIAGLICSLRLLLSCSCDRCTGWVTGLPAFVPPPLRVLWV